MDALDFNVTHRHTHDLRKMWFFRPVAVTKVTACWALIDMYRSTPQRGENASEGFFPFVLYTTHIGFKTCSFWRIRYVV